MAGGSKAAVHDELGPVVVCQLMNRWKEGLCLPRVCGWLVGWLVVCWINAARPNRAFKLICTLWVPEK